MTMGKIAALAIAVLTTVLCVPATANASDNSDVIGVINSAVASFNEGDGKTWETLCTSPVYIISNIAPYQYSTTCADWWNAHAAADKKAGVSAEKVTLGTAWHVTVSGGRAYAAIPASFTYKQKGRTISTSGNVLIVALHKTASGWLMTGWTWAQH